MNWPIEQHKRLLFFLPNTFTALNMACGFLAILLSWKQDFSSACWILVLGAIFDSVDGRVARITGTQSVFGEQFDSMSDLISFGAAPAILFYSKFLSDTGRLGIALAFLFLLCGALRLARFNANIEKVGSDYFQGLPIPGAALALVSYVFFSKEVYWLSDYKILAMIYIFFYSILMISSLPFPSFKHSEWVKTHKRHVLLIIFSVLILIAISPENMMAALITIYVLASIVYFLTHKDKFKGIFCLKKDEE